MNLHRLYITSALIFSGVTWVSAASAEGLSVSKTVIANAKLTAPENPSSVDAKVGMDIISFNIDVPLYMQMHPTYQKPTLFTNQIGFSERTLTYDWPANNTEYKPDKVYAVGYGYDFVKPLSQDWMLVHFATVGMFTDFANNPDERDAVFETGVMGVYQFANGWDIGAGPAYTRAFGKQQILPAPYVRYKYKKSFEIDMKVPKYAKVAYIHEDKAMFALSAKRVYDAFHLNPDPDVQVSHTAAFSDIRVGVDTMFRLYKFFALELSVARTISRSLNIEIESTGQSLSRDLDNTYIFTVGLHAIP